MDLILLEKLLTLFSVAPFIVFEHEPGTPDVSPSTQNQSTEELFFQDSLRATTTTAMCLLSTYPKTVQTAARAALREMLKLNVLLPYHFSQGFNRLVAC